MIKGVFLTKNSKTVMKTNIYIYISIVISLLFGNAVVSLNAFGMKSFLDPTNIKPGDKGRALTVVTGHLIESFDVTVIAVLENSKMQDIASPFGYSILVKASGELIENTGGIAAGMSGSPVFINEVLAGGLAATWSSHDKHLALITPLQDMLKLLSLGIRQRVETGMQNQEWELSEPIEIDGITYDGVELCFNNKGLLEASSPDYQETETNASSLDRTLRFQYVSSPILVEGLGENALKRLNSESPSLAAAVLSESEIAVRQEKKSVLSEENADGAANEKVQNEFQPVPGASIGVQIVRGDVNVTSIGTLTFRTGNHVMAFAHAAYRWGAAQAYFVPVRVIGCFPARETPYKLGVPEEPIGTVLQDRDSGVLARLNRMPEEMKLHVAVEDFESNTRKQANVFIVNNPYIMSEMSGTVIYQTVDSIVGARGAALVSCDFSMQFKTGEKVKSLSRHDVNLVESDAAGWAADTAGSAIDMILENEFIEPEIISMTCEVHVQSGRRSERIVAVRLPVARVKAGSPMRVEVATRIFRGQERRYGITVEIPPSLEEGEYVLEASGAWPGRKGMLEPQRQDSVTATNLDQLIYNYSSRPNGSNVVISITSNQERSIEIGRLDLEGVVEGQVDGYIEVLEREIP